MVEEMTIRRPPIIECTMGRQVPQPHRTSNVGFSYSLGAQQVSVGGKVSYNGSLEGMACPGLRNLSGHVGFLQEGNG